MRNVRLDGFGEVFSLIAPYIGWMVISVAIFSYLLAQFYQRKIFPRVEYHRKGPNAETYQCVELGNRVMFTAGGGFKLFGGKKQEVITAVMNARPEIKVFGFKTIRLHHVLEGFNQTVDIRDIATQSPIGGGALATAEAVMATAFEQMSKSIPKSKTDMIMNVIMILMGLGWGLVVGIIFT